MLPTLLVISGLWMLLPFISRSVGKIAKKRYKRGRPFHTRWSRAPTKSEMRKKQSNANKGSRDERRFSVNQDLRKQLKDERSKNGGACPRCPELEAEISQLKAKVSDLEDQLSQAQRHIKDAVASLEIHWPDCTMEHCVYYRSIIDGIKSKFG